MNSKSPNRKTTNKKRIVKYFGFSSIVLGCLSILFFILMVNNIIPAYSVQHELDFDQHWHYATMGPSAFYITFVLIFSATVFTSIGALILSIKDNHKNIHFLKSASLISLACGVLTGAIANIIFFYDDAPDYIQLDILQAFLWAITICTGIAAFCLSKITSHKKAKEESA